MVNTVNRTGAVGAEAVETEGVETKGATADGPDADRATAGGPDADRGAETGGAKASGAKAGGAKAGGARAPAGRADLSSALGMDTARRVMGKLFALAPRLVEVQDLGAREYGMSYARGRVVAALTVSGPVLMRALSEAVGVTPRTITGLIDALEADGWVERRAHPTDRRATIVALTPAAEIAFARLNENYGRLSLDLVSGIPEADLRSAMRVIEHISARLDDAISRGTAALRADPPTLPLDRNRS